MSLGFFAFLSTFSPEPQHPSVAYGDSSPLKKRAAFAGTNCSAKKEKCADLQSRGLLSSRLRVTPSSRRKAHGNMTALPQKKKVRTLSFEPWIFCFPFGFSPGTSTPLSRLRRQLPSLKEGSLSGIDCSAAERKMCGFSVLKTQILPLLSLRHKVKKRTNQRLPPRGSCRGATEGACAIYKFFKLEAITESAKLKI